MTKLVSLALLGGVFGIGAITADGPAIAAGSVFGSRLATLVVVILMAVGVFFWSRLVRGAHESEITEAAASVNPRQHATLAQPHSEPTA